MHTHTLEHAHTHTHTHARARAHAHTHTQGGAFAGLAAQGSAPAAAKGAEANSLAAKPPGGVWGNLKRKLGVGGKEA